MRDALLRWFDGAARPLPWRQPAGDGPVARSLARDRVYVVWVVETLSQQTRLATVVARLPGFLARFPDLAALAAADLDDVLAAWSGLGYYRRARSLHAAARCLAGELRGRWPATVEGWRRLPGVGPYTAAAVAAQALGVPTIALDGNVRRVGARMLGAASPSDRELQGALTRTLLTGAERARERARAARVAEALVELGALLCTPRSPACGGCPLRPGCAAFATGQPARYPAPRPRPRVVTRALHAWVVLRPGAGGETEVALERRPEDGPWGGMVGPPWRDAPPPPPARRLASFRHALTHRRIEAVAWLASEPPVDAAVRWRGWDELEALGLAEIDRRALAHASWETAAETVTAAETGTTAEPETVAETGVG